MKLKTLFALIALLFVLTVTPTFANQGKSQEHRSENGQECDEDGEWENHGKYVSCVAGTHPGGSVVSEASRSDVGK